MPCSSITLGEHNWVIPDSETKKLRGKSDVRKIRTLRLEFMMFPSLQTTFLALGYENRGFDQEDIGTANDAFFLLGLFVGWRVRLGAELSQARAAINRQYWELTGHSVGICPRPKC